ncbi:MAG: hypothetical protein J7K38_01810 [Thermoplasmata archaeon]|nr:hypothetical protein [Thermoplasmata archaeon]
MKGNTLMLVASFLLLVSIASNLYVGGVENSVSTGCIDVNGVKVCFIELYEKIGTITIHNSITNESYTGVPLDKIIEFAGVKNLEKHSYVIIGADGYRKTVKWEDMTRGVLTEEGRVAFEHLPKAFMVKDVVKIEVV